MRLRDGVDLALEWGRGTAAEEPGAEAGAAVLALADREEADTAKSTKTVSGTQGRRISWPLAAFVHHARVGEPYLAHGNACAIHGGPRSRIPPPAIPGPRSFHVVGSGASWFQDRTTTTRKLDPAGEPSVRCSTGYLTQPWPAWEEIGCDSPCRYLWRLRSGSGRPPPRNCNETAPGHDERQDRKAAAHLRDRVLGVARPGCPHAAVEMIDHLHYLTSGSAPSALPADEAALERDAMTRAVDDEQPTRWSGFHRRRSGWGIVALQRLGGRSVDLPRGELACPCGPLDGEQSHTGNRKLRAAQYAGLGR